MLCAEAASAIWGCCRITFPHISVKESNVIRMRKGNDPVGGPSAWVVLLSVIWNGLEVALCRHYVAESSSGSGNARNLYRMNMTNTTKN